MAPPRLTVTDCPLAAATTEAVALAVPQVAGAPAPTDTARATAEALGISIDDGLASGRATAKAGEVVDLPVAGEGPVRRVLLVGTGDGGPGALRRAGAALARAARTAHIATDLVDGIGPDSATAAQAARAALEGLLLAAYRFDRKSGPPERPDLASVDLHVEQPAFVEDALRAAVPTAAAVHLARDLANTPSNEKDPAWLAGQARDVGRRSGVEVRVLDHRQLEKEGFGGIVAVGAGSSRPPRLIEMTYRPDSPEPDAAHVVLVGKGITFDSGGLSLKPREAMVAMKTDMAAGGAVIAAMGALRDLGVRVPVTGLVAAAENLPGASAMRPGDVIRHYGGRTVEVFNTDAEGRLVLADALAYADARLDPDVLVDLATLTGAASLGLGRRHGALYSAEDGLVAELVAAGEAAGERLWRMPLEDDYRASLDSTVADLSNISRDKTVGGGSIVAALFLREFVGRRRWAHLDIAGPARADRPEHEVSKGGTGFGVRLLLRWLEGLSAAR